MIILCTCVDTTKGMRACLLTARAIVRIHHNTSHTPVASIMRRVLQAGPCARKVCFGQAGVHSRLTATAEGSLVEGAAETIVVGLAALIVQRKVGKRPVCDAAVRARAIAAKAIRGVKDCEVGEVRLVRYLVPVSG